MLTESSYVKLRIIAPHEAADAIRAVLGREGAGVQGNYDFCSFSYPVTGRFRPQAGAEPAVGRIGSIAEAAEEAIEVICHKDRLEKVIAAVRRAHPYEEPAIDIMPRYEVH